MCLCQFDDCDSGLAVVDAQFEIVTGWQTSCYKSVHKLACSIELFNSANLKRSYIKSTYIINIVYLPEND